MRFYLLIIIYFYIFCSIFVDGKNDSNFKYLLPNTSKAIQESALRDLIQRSIGEDAMKYFTVAIDKECFRCFEIKKFAGKITISSSDGVSGAKAFHHYMKYYMHKDITWTKIEIKISNYNDLPDVNLTSNSASDFIYYQNVCTWSYSFVWWEFSTWRKHIDWMAMQGVSLTIAPIQEEIWHDLYIEMGLTEAEITDHFAGPGFQAWQRMGNIRGWGGPLTSRYRHMEQLLQKKIISSLRALGITVALPAFAGHVPVAMQRIYPKVNFTTVERWNHFPNIFCCTLFLEPNEPLFDEIATRFLSAIISVYGTDHIYFADPFNEIQPSASDSSFMNKTSYNIYNSMRKVDNQSIWLLQGWMFVKNIFWTDELIKSFLTAVPKGKMLVLDLQSEQFPQYERTHSFHGQPFIWCMLHNFGGTLGMHGSVNIVNNGIREARAIANSTMIGVGITPEGIHQNYAMYALALERGWQEEDFDLTFWFNTFADARYDMADTCLRYAWQLLRDSVYSYKGLKKMRGKYTITRRPSINLDVWSWYNSSAVHQAWALMLAANASVPKTNYKLYEHDLVDTTRQFLQIMHERMYINLISAYKRKEVSRFAYIKQQMDLIMNDLEEILATNENFLLGLWLQSAKSKAQSDLEQSLLEFNARNQITTWGPNGEILDYATKQWSGIVIDYYKPRWDLFIDLLQKSLETSKNFNNTFFKEIVSKEIENPFSINLKEYRNVTNGNSYLVSKRIFKYWTMLFETPEFLYYLRLFVKLISN